MDLDRIQTYLQENRIDGWLLYDFRGSNPIALHMAGMQQSGSRRWFLWIPAQGAPQLLIHMIERTTFANVDPLIEQPPQLYVSRQELETKLRRLTGANRKLLRTIAMEYSPRNAIPYVSTVDAGTKEMVEAVVQAEIVSSADLVQMNQAVLSDDQIASHRRAAAHCLAVKDAALAFIADHLRREAPLTEYDVQQFIMAEFAQRKLDPDHPPIVAVNRAATDGHYSPTAARHNAIQAGDMVLIDLWAREQNSPQDCFADITWTAYCGAVVPEAVQTVFHAVAAGRDAAVALIQERLAAGKPIHGYEVDARCRAVITAAGFGHGIRHRTGHSLGPEVHFRGVNIDDLETQDRRRLIPGVMFTIEPGVYQPDYDFDSRELDDADQDPETASGAKGLGIRSEINCFVHADRVEVTTLPLQTEVIALLA